MQLRFPPALGPGSTVAICAPSSPFPREELWRGLAWLSLRYRLRLSRAVFDRHGYLAGDDAVRAGDLARRMLDPEIDAIVCARGGYGAMRIVDQLPWEDFARAPKWLVGFSDVTALHAMTTSRGIASVHGPNVTGLGRRVSPAERASFLSCLETPRAPSAWEDLVTLHPGPAVRGPVVGGNLALVHAMGGRFPEGAIVALEDVTERPYRIDRMLTSMVRAGAFARAGAVVFGDFTQCEPGPDRITVFDVLRDRTAGLGVPVSMGAPFGHGSPNHAFVIGRTASLVDRTLTFA